MSMNQSSSGSGPFSKLANMTVSSANNFIGTDFGAEKTGIEKLKEAFNKSVPQSNTVTKKKKSVSQASNTQMYAPSNTVNLCNHNWISAGMRPITASMDSEAVLVCPDCGGTKCIRVAYSVAAYGGPGGGGGNMGGGGGGGAGNYNPLRQDPFANGSNNGLYNAMKNNTFIDPNSYF